MRKYIIGLGVLTLILASCFDPTKKNLSGPYSEYGPFKVDMAAATTVDNMVADFRKNGSKTTAYTVKASIEEVCAKAGCWIHIKHAADKDIMVRFKDHFTIPTDTKVGTMAFLHGELFMDTVSVDHLRHYAEDAGKSQEEIEKITEPRITMGFIADGIKFMNVK
jgi:Domain of unknown function (DUF4920)